MADIIDLFPDGPSECDRLLAQLADLRAQIAALDQSEPEDMDSEAYELWGERHEDLEDQVDELLELLDDL